MGSFSSIFGDYLDNLTNKVEHSSPDGFTVIIFIAFILIIFSSIRSCVSESTQENAVSKNTKEKVVGQEEDGTKSQSFEEAYIRNGGLNRLGKPAKFPQKTLIYKELIALHQTKTNVFRRFRFLVEAQSSKELLYNRIMIQTPIGWAAPFGRPLKKLTRSMAK